MTPLHQRHFTESDREIYAAIGNSLALAGITSVRLYKGKGHAQKFSNRCAAAGGWNALETCEAQWKDFPDTRTSPEEIYRLARQIDEFADHETGTSLYAAADAACRILGGGIRWMALPLDPNIMAAWIATEKTGILYGTQWTRGHSVPTRNVLVPTGEEIAPGHAIHLHGFKSAHSFRTWIFGRRVTKPVFIVENSWTHPEKDFYLLAEDVTRNGLGAVVFIPPDY